MPLQHVCIWQVIWQAMKMLPWWFMIYMNEACWCKEGTIFWLHLACQNLLQLWNTQCNYKRTYCTQIFKNWPLKFKRGISEVNFIEGLLARDCVVVPLEDLERANGVPTDWETEATFVHLQFTHGSGDPPPHCWHPQMCWNGRHWSHAANLTHLQIWNNYFVWVIQFQPVVILLMFPTLTAFPLNLFELDEETLIHRLGHCGDATITPRVSVKTFRSYEKVCVHCVSKRLGRFPG